MPCTCRSDPRLQQSRSPARAICTDGVVVVVSRAPASHGPATTRLCPSTHS
jgi:hypothetical protein